MVVRGITSPQFYIEREMGQKQFSHIRYIIIGLLLGIFCIVGSFLYSLAQVIYYGHDTSVHHADAIVVLGAAAWNTKPSPVFRERINHAVELYRNHFAERIIFTGGTPKSGFMAEAEVGRRYALQMGVANSDILYENLSRDTYHNLLNTRQVMRDNNIEHIIIVSDPFHMARSAKIAKDLGIDAQISPTKTSRYAHGGWAKWRFLLQESYALTVYRWAGWLCLINSHLCFIER